MGRVFQPSLIIYDPFSLLGMMAARVLGIPSVCTITVPALNSYPILSGLASEEEKRRKLQDYRDSSTLSKIGGALKIRWGINPVEEAVLMSCYVPKGLNICTGIIEFEQKMPDAVKAIHGGANSMMESIAASVAQVQRPDFVPRQRRRVCVQLG